MSKQKRNDKGASSSRAPDAPSTAKVTAARKTLGASSALDFQAIRELALIAGEFGLSEVEADPSGRIRIARPVAGAEPLSPAALRSGSPAISLAPPAPMEGAPPPGTLISSPFVGTFYRAPSPEAQPFAEVGQTVRKGQVVCIVEAMKLMNEIEAETDGKVAEILAKNGEHVEYGQGLIRITPV